MVKRRSTTHANMLYNQANLPSRLLKGNTVVCSMLAVYFKIHLTENFRNAVQYKKVFVIIGTRSHIESANALLSLSQ